MSGPADLLFRGGVVWTGDPAMPRAGALAVRKGRVSALGDAEALAPLLGPSTRVVELEGRTLLPGFVDAHTHFLSGGLKLAAVQLREADSPEALARAVGDFAASLPPGRWITGGDWDHERWGGTLPRAEWIDALTPQHPVFVTRLDLHMGLANARALAAAGITAGTPDPAGGTIVRDPATGAPTGILKDRAMDLVSAVIPEPSDAELDAALAAASAHALSLGVTQVHDMGPIPTGSWRHLETYRRAHASGALPLRVYALVGIETWPRMRDHVAEHGVGDAWLRWGGVKGFVDGSLGSATAWFHQPYLDAPETCGLTVTDPAQLREAILGADAAGLHVAVHAIGDRANDWLLDVYGEATRANGPRERRFRVEHAQHLSPGAVARFAELDVIASVQPCHAIDDGPWAERRLGPERIRRTYAFRSLLDAGARLAFGTDWTVAPLDPIPNLAAAVNRHTRGGAHPGGWVPEERVGVEEALRAYTAGAARAGWREQETGVLSPGAQADLALLSGDLFDTPPERIAELRVDATWVAGVEAYARG